LRAHEKADTMAQHEDKDLKREDKLRKIQDKLFELNVNEAAAALLSTDKGRDFLWWLFEQTGINRNPFAASAEITAFNCGLLETGQRLQARCLEVNPDGFLTMTKERTNGRRTSSNADHNARADNTGRDDTGTYADYNPDTGSADDGTSG